MNSITGNRILYDPKKKGRNEFNTYILEKLIYAWVVQIHNWRFVHYYYHCITDSISLEFESGFNDWEKVT